MTTLLRVCGSGWLLILLAALAVGAEPEPAGEPIRVIKPALLGADVLPAQRIAIGEPDDYNRVWPCSKAASWRSWPSISSSSKAARSART
ncbi:MAG: hypothetical protein WD403_04710 [Pirellulales bacterium]